MNASLKWLNLFLIFTALSACDAETTTEQGPPGIQGETGETGPQGIAGIQGETGEQGLTGIQGEKGVQGETGETGLPGLQGLIGVTGSQGIAGIQGETGDPGVPCSGCVDSATLADGAVTADKISSSSVDSDHVVDGSLTFADMADNGCTKNQQMRMGEDGSWECWGGESCVSITLDNRNGNTWKYGKFELPFSCHPPFMSPDYPNTAPRKFGCTLELWPEHHSANAAGYWRGMRSANMAIFPNAENSGHAYMQIWDYQYNLVYDLENGPGENLFGSHTYDVCRFTDSYYNGAGWIQAAPRSPEGWINLGMMANAYTRCTLRICESQLEPGTHSMAERTAGPL
ncbi:collagen-like protein [Myxococcota bacterium]|nr:collagen-like protein [Myxococcota bacterium]